MAPLLLPLLAGLLLATTLEGLLLEPRPVFLSRPPSSWAIHVGLWLLLYALELCLFRRPIFGMVIGVATLLFIILVSKAKYRSLREPFIFQDFEYFTDAIKHPRLYVPFFGLWPSILVAAGFVAVFWTGFTLEAPWPMGTLPDQWPLVALPVAAAGAILLALGNGMRPGLILDPESDLRGQGLLSSLWSYGVEERRPFGIPPSPFSSFDACPGRDSDRNGGLPDIVVIQSESFFDARRLCESVKRDILRHFDRICAESVCHGRLRVPAWGANTVRTEFSFLSGLEPEQLGVHRFNPYRRLARQGVPSLVGYLKRMGYRTVCVHPYPASFYARDKVFERLGFDRFLDIGAFADAPRSGPYVSDEAVAQKIRVLLDEGRGEEPLFVFAITMENHGPLHLESVAPGEAESFMDALAAGNYHDLVVYLRHLAHADQMAGLLKEYLSACDRDACLCFYGDHVPIMPDVYRANGFDDADTEYFIWRKTHDRPPAQMDIDAEKLGGLLVATALGTTPPSDRSQPMTGGC